MKSLKLAAVTVLCVLISLSLASCMKTRQARSVDAKTILVDHSILKEEGGDKALLLYKKEKKDSPVYTRIMVDPVLMYKPADATPEDIADLQKLANNFYMYLKSELGNDFEITNAPAPGTLRIQAAILDADSSNRFTDTMSSVVPYSVAFSILKDFATGKPTGVGEITAEMKFSDASTNELLGAMVDRRVGGKGMGGLFDTWNDANASMEYWAKKTRYVMCVDMGKKNCVKPDNY